MNGGAGGRCEVGGIQRSPPATTGLGSAGAARCIVVHAGKAGLAGDNLAVLIISFSVSANGFG